MTIECYSAFIISTENTINHTYEFLKNANLTFMFMSLLFFLLFGIN